MAGLEEITVGMGAVFLAVLFLVGALAGMFNIGFILGAKQRQMWREAAYADGARVVTSGGEDYRVLRDITYHRLVSERARADHWEGLALRARREIEGLRQHLQSPPLTAAWHGFRSHGVALASGRIEEIARACHEINAAYCRAMGDDSQPSWENAPAWQRESAIAGVRFHFDNPDAPPSASHENWMAEKERTGWKYGPRKDPEAKTHPCMVPFDALPAEQQAKDFLFHATVRVAAALVSLNGSIQDRKEYYDQIFQEWLGDRPLGEVGTAWHFANYLKQRLHIECHPLPTQEPDHGEHRPA